MDLERIVRGVRARIRRVKEPDALRRHGMVGPPEVWREKRQFQIDFVKQQGLQPQQTFLDVGCGTLRGGIPIIDYLEAGNYMGTEVRDEVLDEAREELKKSGLEAKRPVLVRSDDFNTLQSPMSFDMAWAFSVLIHMSDDISRACLGFIARNLKDGGQFFANVRLGDRHDNVGHRGFPVVTRPLSYYEEIASGLSVTDMGTLESLGHRTGKPGDQHKMLRFARG
jgi:cyclopropane fatty-acyl-phospholipid synthase-like methyltransferase